jgi:hypothetical protein
VEVTTVSTTTSTTPTTLQPAPAGRLFDVQVEHGPFVPLFPGRRQAAVTITVPELAPVTLIVLRPVRTDAPWGQVAAGALAAHHAGAALTDQTIALGRVHDWLANRFHYQALNRAWAEQVAARLARRESVAAAERLAAHRDAWPAGDTLITVRRHWNSPRKAVYRLADVRGFHWSRVSGGRAVHVPRPFVHASVSCEGQVAGAVAHSCTHGPAPHLIKVCLTAVDNGGTRSPLTRHIRAVASDTPNLTKGAHS